MGSGCPWLCWSCIPLPTGTLMLPLRGPVPGEGVAAPSICRGPPGHALLLGPGGAAGCSSPPDGASLPPVTQPEPPAPGPLPALGAVQGGPTSPRAPRAAPGTRLGLLPAPRAAGGRGQHVRGPAACAGEGARCCCAWCQRGPRVCGQGHAAHRVGDGWLGAWWGRGEHPTAPLCTRPRCADQGCKYWRPGCFCCCRCAGWEKVAEFAPGPSGGPPCFPLHR